MKKDIPGMLKRAERFQVILIGEGVLVGIVAGLVVLLYRVALEYAGHWLTKVLEFTGQSIAYMAMWFAVLLIMAWIVSRLVKFEPMISGSGIPQLKGEMTGKFDQCWWKVLIAKFVGGFLCIFGGLALGREGPSIQIGAMAGKGVSKCLDRGKTEERFLLTCGASAGLAAAFHAPLAGVMFSLEEIHKNFSVSVLLSVMTASITADYLCSVILGVDSVFQFEIVHSLPPAYYWMLLILGVLLGALGAFYNWFTLKAQSLYNKIKAFKNESLNGYAKVAIPFLCAGVLGFTCPQLLGSGHSLIENMAAGEMVLGTIILVFIGRFIFSAVSFGSGAPGGIFFPLLVLGGFIGGAFGTAAVEYLGVEPMYINNFIALAMAGYFAAIVRAPLTGIVLIFEMTGSLDQLLSLSVISIMAYITATMLGSKPIYDSLLDRLWEKTQAKDSSAASGKEDEKSAASGKTRRQKVLAEYGIRHSSPADGKLIKDIEWPDNCLLVAIQRGEKEIIPKGHTKLQAGDIIVTMTDERDEVYVYERLEKICRETMSR
ncbi:MAG: ClC family H(+)/Cl(-) exchange transporter [Bacillota bacterium]|nr:ClC family H(+)/Cl(-) exchange transporter [Bacillota bacterium]